MYEIILAIAYDEVVTRIPWIAVDKFVDQVNIDEYIVVSLHQVLGWFPIKYFCRRQAFVNITPNTRMSWLAAYPPSKQTVKSI